MYNKFALFLSAIGKIKINMQGKTAVLKDNLMFNDNLTLLLIQIQYNKNRDILWLWKNRQTTCDFYSVLLLHWSSFQYTIHPSYYFHCYLHITTHTCTLDYVTVHRLYTKTSKHSVHLLWKLSAPEISNWKWNWKRYLAFFQVVWKKR